jgi:hypothetical protein
MGKWTGTVSVVALLAAIGVWSTSTLVTKAAINEQAATAANSFPTAAAADFIREPDGVERKLMNAGKADRLASIADCGKQEWPFLSLDCFVATPKPARPAEPTVTVERRTGSNTSELVRASAPAAPAAVKTATPASAPAMAAAPTMVAASATVAAPACKQNLAVANARVERALAHVKGRPASAEACAGYRRDFFEMVKAREVTAMCKTGAERDRDLGTIDVAVESINGAIAQSCGG